MKVCVRLYGTLGRHIEGYEHAHGLLVDIPDGATVGDLFAQLKFTDRRGIVAIMEGRVLNAQEPLGDGKMINVFQSIAGG
jgi:sulfur carrier protein ThiS